MKKCSMKAKNVSVCLCSIECNRGQNIETGCPDFARDLAEWSALTDNLMVWDYVVQFRSYISPFPNWNTLQPNLQLFQKSGVRMMFEQGSGRDKSEFSDMRAYLLAKLMWNPAANMDSILTDFGEGYYGPARPFIWEYVHQLTEAVTQGDGQLTIYNIPQNEPFLKNLFTRDFLDQKLRIPMTALRDDSVHHARASEALLSALFAMMEMAKTDSLALQRLANETPAGSARGLGGFVEGCRLLGIRNLHENGYTPEQYRENYMAFLEKSRAAALSRTTAVRLEHPASPTYAGGRAEELVNRRIGETDYRYNWLGFEGADLVAAVEIEGDSLSEVEVSFLQDQQAWVFFPEKMTIEISADGRHFEKIHGEDIPLAPDGQKAIKTVSVQFPARPARFVRVTAVNIKTCPPWHSCVGNPCWIFADEIVVR